MKPLAQYDWAFALCVDYRLERERDRIQKIMDDQGIAPDRMAFFIDGHGQQLPRQLYSQISPVNIPSTWKDMPASYSHFTAIRSMVKEAIKNHWRHFLLIEDDLVLADDFEEVAGAAMSQLPATWDMMYYGANHSGHRTRQVGPNLLRCFGSACTHCVAFRHTIYDAILSLPEDRTIDWNIGHRLHDKYECYAAWPNTATQKPGYSLLWKQQVDYSHLWENSGDPA